MSIFVGAQPLSSCPNCDANGNGSVSSGDFAVANRNFQEGCASPPTPTHTPTSDGTETMETSTPTRTNTAVIVNTPVATSTPASTATATAIAATNTPTATSIASVEVETTLSDDISTTDDIIAVDDVTGFAPSGVVAIGDELILYSEIVTAAVLSGAQQPGILIVAERGFMGTPVQEHAGESTVRFVPPPDCVGDCDGGDSVTIGELIRGVGISLGNQAVTVCLAMDDNLNGAVAINELIRAVNNSLQGCDG